MSRSVTGHDPGRIFSYSSSDSSSVDIDSTVVSSEKQSITNHSTATMPHTSDQISPKSKPQSVVARQLEPWGQFETSQTPPTLAEPQLLASQEHHSQPSSADPPPHPHECSNADSLPSPTRNPRKRPPPPPELAATDQAAEPGGGGVSNGGGGTGSAGGVALDLPALMKMRAVDLRALCGERGLPAYGTKAILAQRLLAVPGLAKADSGLRAPGGEQNGKPPASSETENAAAMAMSPPARRRARILPDRWRGSEREEVSGSF
jgi:hypothetical protein